MRQAFLLVILLISTLASSRAMSQHTLQLIQDSGPSENRIDFLVMADGYSDQEQEALEQDTQDAIEKLFSHWPMNEYQPFFNIMRIATVSNESGADHPDEDVYVDSFFGCFFDCYGYDRMICCDDPTIFEVAGELFPAYDQILMVVNDTEYGGAGGPIAITSIDPSAADIPPHELGHSFAHLADEYESSVAGLEFEDIYANISPTADRESLKWNSWVGESTPLPTPENEAVNNLAPVGAYEGAFYQSEGLYRPVDNCLMRSLESEFCPVCTEAMVLSFYEYVEPVDAYSPAVESIAGEMGDTLAFSIEAVEPNPKTITFSWFLDNELINGADTADFELDLVYLTQGDHTLEAEVVDQTTMVINDPDSLLSQNITWTVTRTDDGPVDDSGPGDPSEPSPDGGGSKKNEASCGCKTIGDTYHRSILGLL